MIDPYYPEHIISNKTKLLRLPYHNCRDETNTHTDMFSLNKTRCDAPPANAATNAATNAAEPEVAAPPKMPSVESFESKAYRKVRLLCSS